MLNYTSQQNSMNIQITQKDIPDDVKPNYYHCLQFWDFLKADDTSNFLNINRIRTDLPFLKKNQIGININIKNLEKKEIFNKVNKMKDGNKDMDDYNEEEKKKVNVFLEKKKRRY